MGEVTEKEIIRAERNSGVISNRVREIQVSIVYLIAASTHCYMFMNPVFDNALLVSDAKLPAEKGRETTKSE